MTLSLSPCLPCAILPHPPMHQKLSNDDVSVLLIGNPTYLEQRSRMSHALALMSGTVQNA
eukprot:scaffold46011_cov42-Prasinocladus_malaysianus.AAC.1